MKPQTMETLAWVLIYGGGLLVFSALAIFDASEALAWTIKVCGFAGIAGGVFLIWLRSRKHD